MTKRLDLIFNGKGGVGKSFFAVNFVQYLKDKNIPFTACDCDNENSTLKRFHGDDVQFLDLSHPRGLDAMIRALDQYRSRGRGLPRRVHRSILQLFRRD